jgi:hypothetical protein
MKKALRKCHSLGIDSDKKPRSAFITTLSWMLYNEQCERILKDVSNRSMIRLLYNEMCENPHSVMQKLSEVVGVSEAHLLDSSDGVSLTPPDHVLAGNRLRMKSKLKLQSDNEWETMLPVHVKLLYRLMAGRRSKAYGLDSCDKTDRK